MAEGEDSNGIYLRTDEHLEFIDALNTSAYFSKEVLNNTYAMKWLILALHASLQGACVCALRGYDTSGVSVLSNASRKEWLNWFEESRDNGDLPAPEFEKLADLKTLYKRVTKTSELRHPFTFHQDSKINFDVKRLNSLRNNFIHFVPKGWSIELSGMPRIVSSVTEVIEHLVIRHPSAPHHLTDDNRNQVGQSLQDIRNNIAQWARRHDIQNGSRPLPG